MRDRIAEDLASGLQSTLRNVSRPPRLDGRTIATMSGASIPSIWRGPKMGRMFESRRLLVVFTWRALLSSFQCSSHRAATVAKEFRPQPVPRSFLPSGVPWDQCGRQKFTTVAVTFASSAKGTWGYFPSAISFSLPSNRYFQRHSLPPAGVTSRRSPPESLMLYDFSFGFARLSPCL